LGQILSSDFRRATGQRIVKVKAMPVVFQHRGFRYFYSNEGIPREPVHIHVERDKLEAKFWLLPELRLAYNAGLQ
jgi:hypothetical protein